MSAHPRILYCFSAITRDYSARSLATGERSRGLAFAAIKNRDIVSAASRETKGYVAKVTRILVIEDDPAIAREVVAALQHHGYGTDHAENGAQGLDAARSGEFDALVVDCLLPECDGLSLLRRLRSAAVRTPALILSALGTTDDKVSGLRAGGDDYLVKPFATEELLARLEALLRRTTANAETALRIGTLHLDLIERRAWRGNRSLDLLMREFKLLEYMMRHAGLVVTRSMLLEDVWNYRFIPKTNLVDVHMGRLRRKLELGGEAPIIESVRGIGFVLHVPD
ncbi:MAG: response regulator transcription factor [Rhodospirillales bacterium]|nr:response regulator transcription factor [Rhodospirillales bacterium]